MTLLFLSTLGVFLWTWHAVYLKDGHNIHLFLNKIPLFSKNWWHCFARLLNKLCFFLYRTTSLSLFFQTFFLGMYTWSKITLPCSDIAANLSVSNQKCYQLFHNSTNMCHLICVTKLQGISSNSVISAPMHGSRFGFNQSYDNLLSPCLLVIVNMFAEICQLQQTDTISDGFLVQYFYCCINMQWYMW